MTAETSGGACIRVRPICATCWDEKEAEGQPSTLDDLSRSASLAAIEKTVDRGDTVWIETYLDGLTAATSEWFEGVFDVWDSMDNPEVHWDEMKAVLEAARLPLQEYEKHQQPLLRAMPFVYTRGVYGTIRDALSSDEKTCGRRLARSVAKAEPFTALPAIGFRPSEERRRSCFSYVAIRSVLVVAGFAVFTMRLPDLHCSGNDLEFGERRCAAVPLKIPRRFLPLLRAPRPREVAEAIGIHQATTARAVTGEVRRALRKHEATTKKLGSAPKQDGRRQQRPRDNVVKAAHETAEMAEAARKLDLQISQILRRFGHEDPSAGRERWTDLVPPEVRRRYVFALEDVRQLHADCQLTSQILSKSLDAYDHTQRERLQFIAALLASVVLVPTLIASVFGVNFGVPGEESVLGFAAFVLTIVGLGVLGYVALRRAEKYHWSPPKRELLAPLLGAGLLLALLVAVLVVES